MARETRVAELGEDPLNVAIANYRAMVEQLAVTEDQLRHARDMTARLMQENDILRRDLDQAKRQRDQYQAVAINLSTRAVMLREAAENLIGEAMRAGANPEPIEAASVGPVAEIRANRAEREMAAEEEAERLLRSSAKPLRRDILPNAFNS